MKKSMLSSVLLVSSIFLLAQIPQEFNYQAIIRNTNGTLKANETIALQIGIVDAQGDPLYMEVHNTTTNEYGLLNVIVGQGISSDDLSAIDWSAGPYFLEITVNGSTLGTNQLLSVPYALYSMKSNEVKHGDNWGTQTITTDESLSGDGTISDPLNIAQQGATAGQVLKWSGTSWSPGTDDSGSHLWENDGDNIYYNTGMVGIGTNNPRYDLDLNKTSGDSHIMVRSLTNGAYLTLDMEGSYQNNYSFINFRKGGEQRFTVGLAYDNFRIYNQNAKGLLVKSDGNIVLSSGSKLGIGINDPDGLLHVYGTALFRNGNCGLRVGPSTETAAHIRYVDNTTTFANLVIKNGVTLLNGYVGIGTANPDTYLHVDDRIRVGDDISYGNVYGELIHEGGGSGFRINANANGGWADLLLQTDGTTRLFIESAGNVGIGTTSPSKRLYVNGSAGGTQAWNASDMRFKKNIKTIQSSLDRIMHLRGVRYEWRDGSEDESTGFDNKLHYGVIAQEVEEIFPYLVDQPGETDEMKHVEYNGLIGILVEAIKELKVQNDDLRKRIEALEH